GAGLGRRAPAAAGVAQTYAQLFAARAAVGIGEATYAPAASALISERFSPQQRARAMGVFQLGMVMGSGTGYGAGGLIGAEGGWRAAGRGAWRPRPPLVA